MKQFLVLTLSLLSFSAFSQKVDQSNYWYELVGNHTITDRYKIHTLISQRRHGELLGKAQQSLIRVGVIRDLNKQVAIGVGYDHVVSFPYGEFPILSNVTEQRSFERLVVKHKLSEKVKMSHRYLLEQRYTAGQDTKHRLRYRLTASIPLVKLKQNRVLKLTGFDELFVKFDNSPNRFNQNWAYLGLSYPIRKNKAIHLGYMNQYLVKGDRNKIENNHTPTLTIQWNLDFRKKDE